MNSGTLPRCLPLCDPVLPVVKALSEPCIRSLTVYNDVCNP